MKSKFFHCVFQSLSCILLGFAATAKSDVLKWHELSVPRSTRYDDLHFIDPKRGWAVGNDVQITKDGGQTWTAGGSVPAQGVWFRAVKFLNRQHGFVGAIPSSENFEGALFETHDGGLTWSDITDRIPGASASFCGLSVVGRNHVFGVGAYWGSPAFYKSTDAGKSWIRRDLSHLAEGLVDIHMRSRLEGFAAGAAKNPADGALILHTIDGGRSWSVAHKTGVEYDWFAWKIQFVNQRFGIASIQSSSNERGLHFLKTQDGGRSWTRHRLAEDNPFDLQGIGFINELQGWAGGWERFGRPDIAACRQTSDGGSTWKACEWGFTLNRFQVFSPNLAFAAGRKIYRFSTLAPPTVTPTASELPEATHKLKVEATKQGVKFEMDFNNDNYFVLDIVDATGKRIRRISQGPVKPGIRNEWLSREELRPGVYSAVMATNSYPVRARFVVEE